MIFKGMHEIVFRYVLTYLCYAIVAENFVFFASANRLGRLAKFLQTEKKFSRRDAESQRNNFYNIFYNS